MGKEQPERILGANIRKLRKKRGISLQDIAANTGVSKSFISQVENGKTQPSLSTLISIAEYLDTSINTLLDDHSPEPGPMVKENEQKTVIYADGIVMNMLTKSEAYKQIQPILYELEAGASSGKKQYQHFGQEFVYIIEGCLEIELGGEIYNLEKGDSLYFNSSVPHSFRNKSCELTKALWIDTPATL